MSELTPITRVESYLDAIVNNGIPPTEDITRIETFLQAIYDNQVCALTPVTRIEMFLGKISGQNIVLPEPITRIELYLAAIAGEDVELPENPITRLEMYLAEWADSGDWTTISGAIVEFITTRAHKLKSCVVSLSPQQDLHGYDSPWPAGGGKNLLNWSVVAVGTTRVDIVNENDGSKLFPLKAGTYTFSNNGNNCYAYWRKEGTSDINIIHTTASKQGTFTLDIDANVIFWLYFSGIDVDSFTQIQLETGTTATPYSPYSNICPISGHTGVDVNVAGKNLIDVSDAGNTRTNTGSTTIRNATSNLKFKPNTQYTFSISTQAIDPTSTYAVWYFRFYHTDGTVTPYFPAKINDNTIADGQTMKRYTVTSDAGKTVDHIELIQGTNYAVAYKDVMLEEASSASDFEPYNGDSYSVTWEDEAGTVYGGTVDVVSGLLTIDRKSVLLSAFNFNLSSPENYIFRAEYLQVIPDIISHDDGSSVAYGDICDSFSYKAWSPINASDNGKFSISVPSNNRIVFIDHRFSSAADFQNAVQDVRLCYKIATPITIQLTPQQITALKGYNAMWSNGGDITVIVRGTSVEVETLQALNMLLGGAYRNNQTADDVSDEEALDIILGGEQR